MFLLQLQFYNIFTNVLFIIFTNFQVKSSTFIWLLNYTSINFIENVLLGAKDTFGTKFKKKKNPRQDSFFKMQRQKKLFLVYQTLFLFSAINLVYVLEINIFGRDYSTLNLQYIRKVYFREQRQYLIQFDALEKKV